MNCRTKKWYNMGLLDSPLKILFLGVYTVCLNGGVLTVLATEA